jgi:hypothetical protein
MICFNKNNVQQFKNSVLHEIVCYYHDNYVPFDKYETSVYYDDLKQIMSEKYEITNLKEYLNNF